MISAEIVLDSVSPQGHRLTTYKLRYPKMIHGEFMTHRMISRNASSSRAIPTSKYLEEVRSKELRAAPVFWGANQKGMQAGAELSDEVDPTFLRSPKQRAEAEWALAAHKAAACAEELARLGVHKQIVNRILEPFLHINVLASATEWDNFFGLRLHRDAQPEIQALAQAMWKARNQSTPKLLKPGDWHLPFVEFVRSPNYETSPVSGDYVDDGVVLSQRTAIMVSVARCARISYESFETGKRSTAGEDVAFYKEKLHLPVRGEPKETDDPIHASPAEHQGTPDRDDPLSTLGHQWHHRHEHGNFHGFRQLRKMLDGEACAPLPEGYRLGS